MNNKIELSIILVNWNGGQVTLDCLESIYKHIKEINYEVILVDNNSIDSSLQKIEELYPDVKLIKNNFNNLFAGANNQGYDIARGEYILILNTDTVILDSSIQDMVALYRERAELGAITCKLLNADYTTQYYMHRRFPTYTSIVLSFVHKKFSRFQPKPVKSYLYLDTDFNKDQYIDQAAGAFILTKRSVIDSIGGLFDEDRFPLFYNDVDFCFRVKIKSLKILFLSNKSILHLKGQSTGKLNFIKSGKYYAPAAVSFFKKHNKKIDYLLLKCSFLGLFGFLSLQNLIRFKLGRSDNSKYLDSKSIFVTLLRL